MCFSPLWSGVFLNVMGYSNRMKILLYLVSFCPLKSNIGTQSVQELFFCDSIRRTVYSNDLVKFFWLRYTARKKLGIYDVHTMLHRQW